MRGMNKKLLAAVLLSSTCSAFAAPVGETFSLRTAHTEMTFARHGASWLVQDYGPVCSGAADVAALATPPRWSGTDSKNATLAVRGADSFSGGSPERFGGLAVVHADGCLSTELGAASAETVADLPGVTHLVLSFKDPVYPFFVVQHFRAMGASDVIETWLEIRHAEKGPVRLSSMASLSFRLPAPAPELHLLSLVGRWAAENQISEAPVARGQAVSLLSRCGIHSAWDAAPAFMLSIGPRASETSGHVLGAILAWSGPADARVLRDSGDSVLVSLGVGLPDGPYVLDPGRTLVLPRVALTFSAAGKGAVSRSFHRWARDYQFRDGHILHPVLLNSWEGAGMDFTESSLASMMDGAHGLGAEMFVLDDGWFANGKFARNDDRRGLGDWVINTNKLPHGLGALAGEANKRGLAFGLWVEPEMANTTSDLATAHPSWILRESGRRLRQGRGGTQVVLDLANPAVQSNLFDQLDAVYKGIPSLAYVKWDANADVMNAGSAFLPADRQANLWFDYTAGLYSLLDRLHQAYPHIILQACASGGGRMDYGFLRYADEFWASDDTDARERVFIQWGASQFFPACAMASHITACPNGQAGNRTLPMKFRCNVAMSGRLGVELVPGHLSTNELAAVRAAVAAYKTTLRPIVQQGDLYRLVSPLDHDHAALMYVSPDRSAAVVFLYGLVRRVYQDFLPPLVLQGLDPARRYSVSELDVDPDPEKGPHSSALGKVVGGDALMQLGLPVRLYPNYDSAVFVLKASN